MSMMQLMMGGTSGVTTLFTGSLTSQHWTGGPSSGDGYNPAQSPPGVLTPSTFSVGGGPTLTINGVQDIIITGPIYQSRIDISGFASDPGFAFLYSAQWGANPEFVYTRGATGYNYNLGSASWTFSVTSTPNFGLAAGGTANLILRG